MQKRQPAKSSEPPPLLPLEYCRPERAAKLLNCEIEDLFHWAAVGAIKFYVNAAKAKDGIKTGGTRLPKEIPPTFVTELDDLEGAFKFGAAFDLVPLSGVGPKYECTNDGFCYLKFSRLSGFWAIAPIQFWVWEQGGGIPESDEYKLYLYSSFDFSESAYFTGIPDIDLTLEVCTSFPSLTDNLWLMREDLEKIHQHIHTGQSFPIRENYRRQARDTMRRVLGLQPLQPSLTLETQQPSPVAVSWDNARAGILAAALHLLAKQFPDICKTKGLLAADAFELAEDIRKKLGGHPLTIDGALSLIDQAIKDGSVHKRQK